MRRERSLSDHASELALVIVGGALFPRFARPRAARVGPRGLVLSIALQAAFLFAQRQWMRPLAERLEREHEQRRTALRAELGREPTQLELRERQLREKGVL
jgi:hypothetical protein